MDRDDERRARRKPRDDRSGEPVHVDEVGVARGSAKGPDHREREQRREPGAALDGADDPAAVEVEPVGAVDTGRDDLHFDAALAQAGDGIRDEAAGKVVRVPRIGRREDGDLEGLCMWSEGEVGRAGLFARGALELRRCAHAVLIGLAQPVLEPAQ